MATSHPHTHVHVNTPCSPQDVDAFLNEAETLVARQGQRMTKIRRKVLRLLLESPEPAKAYDLLANLDGEGSAKPPTIYRALDFLQDTGLAHKIESLNAYVACGHTRHRHSAVFLICEDCKRVAEIDDPAVGETLARDAADQGFSVSTQMIEVMGRCPDCRAQAHG